MSLMDRIKALFSGGSAEHDHAHDDGHEHAHDYNHPHTEPTPEEIAAAAQAEPPTTTVEGLSEDEPKDEVH
jgi:hypothetical protein